MTETVVSRGSVEIEAAPGSPPAPPEFLENATRELHKATLVPLNVSSGSSGQALVKAGYVGRLALRPGDVATVGRRMRAGARVDDAAPVSDATLDLLAGCEEQPVPSLLPATSAFTEVPVEELRAFGDALVALRREHLDQAAAADPVVSGEARHALHAAVLAVKGLEADTTGPKFSMLNLERLEMTPAGIERGELVGTVPLAPLEQTAVTQKEWSVQKKEFTSIVTDELETLSETGVTDNTELSQSTNSQQEHSNQFNITGTVSGGIPVISGSVSSGYTGQSRESQSAAESRKHATTLTQKASSRARQEHKVTIATTTVTGTSQSTTRTLRNPSDTHPLRIDYYSMMRKWRVRLYRYGLRQTYDVVLPEPAASMRRDYVRLEELKARLGPFVFNLAHSDITAAVREDDPEPPPTTPKTEKPPHYIVLAERYHAPAPPPPPRDSVTLRVVPDSGPPPDVQRSGGRATVNVPAGYEIESVRLTGRLTSRTDKKGQFTVEGTTIPFTSWNELTFEQETLFALGGGRGEFFLAGSTGTQPIVMTYDFVATASLEFTVKCVPTAEATAQWRTEVWNLLYNAAQTQYYAEQQDIAGEIAALEERLRDVDTLTLRREENDEIMKGVLRYLLGNRFPAVPGDVVAAFREKQVDLAHGTSFDDHVIGSDSSLWTVVQQYENAVRFINQAIEWENVVTFLYSYFWDLPDSWTFIRRIQYPDAARQAFLRAGSARVVLTVRKGWETRWTNFVETGKIDDPSQPVPASPYWTIAQEIAAYDDRNYPGIPPANPGRAAARLQDAVITTCSAALSPSTSPVTVPVASSAGFVVGAQVVIDAVRGVDHDQEVQTIVAVPEGGQSIKVARLDRAHHGTPAVPIPVTQLGEKGELIAEWTEYTPSSGTDIAVTGDLTVMA